MNIRFDNKRALVTGAGKGIGRAIAKALVGGGAETYALTRTQSDLDSLKEEYPSIHPVCVDLADWDATRKAVQDIGVIDLLVNNAANQHYDSFLKFKKEDLDSTYDINLKADINVSQVVAKGMVERGQGGRIVMISGTSSQLAYPELAVHSSAKAALDQLTRAMALELGPHQIRVNAVNPTCVLTDNVQRHIFSNKVLGEALDKLKEERIPLKRFCEVKDVVHPVLFLLSDQSDMINGVSLMVNGGLNIC